MAEKYSLSFQHNISQTKMSEFVSEHSTDYLQKIVKNSHTFTDVAKYFNVSVPFIKKVMIALSIDYTHFDRYYYHTNKNIFTNGNRVPAKQLLAGLNSMGRTRCESCGNNGTWNGYPIPLEVHHINGIHEDNRIENLMIVCPNCHASIEERGTDIEKRKPKTQVIIQEANCKCERCKEEKWMNRNIPLEIHHTSGDHFDCSSPLEVLCPNCHAVETLLQNKQRKPKNITDNMLVQALSNSPSIHQGILSIGLSPTGSTYKRARRLVEQHHIKHLMPLTSSLVEEIESYLLSLPVIKEELVKDICKTYGINKKDMRLILQGKHIFSYQLSVELSQKQGKQDGNRKRKCGNRQYSHCIKEISRDDLKHKIRTMSFEAIGREFHVTGNTVKRWCKYYKLPFRKKDIKRFSDSEWQNLETFILDDGNKNENQYSYEQIISVLERTRSTKYVIKKLGVTKDMIVQARKKLNYHDHAIEWSKTTCYLKDLGLYFRSISDVGHWLAEQGTNMMYLSPTARKIRFADI